MLFTHRRQRHAGLIPTFSFGVAGLTVILGTACVGDEWSDGEELSEEFLAVDHPDFRLGNASDGNADVFFPTGSAWYVSYSGTSGWNYLNTSAALLDEITIGICPENAER